MTHWPALIFSVSKCRACLSAYFTPISIFVSIPLVFAYKRKGKKYHTLVCQASISCHSQSTSNFYFFLRLFTMLASASSVVWTWVMFPFSNRSLASKMSLGFRPYARMPLMKFPRFSSCGAETDEANGELNTSRSKQTRSSVSLVRLYLVPV